MNLTRVIVFCISAFLAAVAGAMIGPLAGNVNGMPFKAFQSLTLLVVLAIAGPGNLRSAFVAAIALVVVPSYITRPTVVDFLPVLFGVSAIAIALLSAWTPRRRQAEPGATPGATRVVVDRSRSPVTERIALAATAEGSP